MFDFVNAVIDNIWEKRTDKLCPDGKFIRSNLPPDLNQLISMFPFVKWRQGDREGVRDLNERIWVQTCDMPIFSGNVRVQWNSTFKELCGNDRKLYLVADLNPSYTYLRRTLRYPGCRQDEIKPLPDDDVGSWSCYKTNPKLYHF
jgi:hypothetical protein